MVSSHSLSLVPIGSSSTETLFTDSYSYDDNSNIASISRLQNGQAHNISYEYDGLDQLIRVNDQKANATTLYTYDAGGNITSAKTYPYTTGSISGSPLSQKTYSYSSSGWKDLLTNFNGDSIIYDEIGNPTQYRDGMTFDWESGRRLANVTQGTNSYSYSYDSSGVRISKTVNGTTYSYIYDNGQLIYADTPVGGMTFFYENDSVAGYKYGPEYYYYIKNLQGDIIGVIDKNCTLLYQYEYDAWGNHTVLDAQGNTISPDAPHVANFNPLRYRGYFFDTETGLYYLLSRYYDPETGRFVNADDTNILLIDQNNIIETNLFAYCLNNPVNMTDDSGFIAWWIGAAIGGAIFDTVTYLIGCAVTGQKVTWSGVGKAALTGAVSGVAFGALGKGVKAIGSTIKTTKIAQKGIGVLNKASNAAFKAAQRINKFSISNKHLASAGGRWAKFATNSKSQVNRWVKEALKSNNAAFYPNSGKNSSYYLITDLGRRIGTKGQTKVKVVFDSSGNIWTAIPWN